jgi:tRNA wybutosine-synthesizing protein 1
VADTLGVGARRSGGGNSADNPESTGSAEEAAGGDSESGAESAGGAGGVEVEMDIEDGGGGACGGQSREMVTPALRSALTKQGYKLVGSPPPPSPY